MTDWKPVDTEAGVRVGHFLLPHGTSHMSAVLYALRWVRDPENQEAIFWEFTRACGWEAKGKFNRNPWSIRTIRALARYRKVASL